MDRQKFISLSGNGHFELSREILEKFKRLAKVNIEYLHLNDGMFADGEPDQMIPQHEKIKGKIALLFQSIHPHSLGLQDEFTTLIWATKKQYGAKMVIGIVPFMCYRRQDHPENTDEIHRNLMFVEELKNKGLDALVLCDIHSKQTLINCQNVGLPVWNTDPTFAFKEIISPLARKSGKNSNNFHIYSPDLGSAERAAKLAKSLGVSVAITLKERSMSGEVKINQSKIQKLLNHLSKDFGVIFFYADNRLKGSHVCIREDELDTGTTARTTAFMLREKFQVSKVTLCATHAVFSPGWRRKLLFGDPFDYIFIGDTIPRTYRRQTGGKIITVGMASLIAGELFTAVNALL